MPTVLQFRRGTTAQNNAFTGTVGELSVDTTVDTLRLHDGSTAGGFELTTNAATQTLTNKTINSASNTITITESNISDLGSYITASSTDTLTNKTIDADNNTISNIGDSELSSGISATKIGNGDVDNTELSYLNGVTSSIQTQIDAKAGTGKAIAMSLVFG